MDLTVARIIHVFCVVLWIGGVGFVTTVLFPSLRRSFPPEERLVTLLHFEEPFAQQARIVVGLAGASGLYMTWRTGSWARFASLSSWWLDAMVVVWLTFAAMLYLVEPFYLNRRLELAISTSKSAVVFDRMEQFHRLMLASAIVAIIGGVGGSHGLF